MICTPRQIIFCVIKSRRKRSVGHVAHMGDMRNTYMVLVERPEGKETNWKTQA